MTTAGLVVIGSGGRGCVACERRRRRRKRRRELPWVQRRRRRRTGTEAGRREIGAGSLRLKILLPALILQ
jgi:hypothetical protein